MIFRAGTQYSTEWRSARYCSRIEARNLGTGHGGGAVATGATDIYRDVMLMPITYKRNDQRRLITVTVTEPYSVDDVLSVIDRQAAEDTWRHALLYDLRGVTHAGDTDLQQIADRVKAVGGGHERGPVGIAIHPKPALFLVFLTYIQLAKGLETIEVLLSAAQIDDWLARNAGTDSSRKP